MFKLYISMNTDDDCEIFYEGKAYCFYNKDLKACKEFSRKEDAINHLTRSLRVGYGGKASKWTYEWLEEAIAKLKKGEQDSVSFSGNQEYEIEIEEVVPTCHNEVWGIRHLKGQSLVNITSTMSSWFIAEKLTYNNAKTIVEHFNKHGRVKLDHNGDPL